MNNKKVFRQNYIIFAGLAILALPIALYALWYLTGSTTQMATAARYLLTAAMIISPAMICAGAARQRGGALIAVASGLSALCGLAGLIRMPQGFYYSIAIFKFSYLTLAGAALLIIAYLLLLLKSRQFAAYVSIILLALSAAAVYFIIYSLNIKGNLALAGKYLAASVAAFAVFFCASYIIALYTQHPRRNKR